jgi:hypothetical protein
MPYGPIQASILASFNEDLIVLGLFGIWLI